MSIVYGANVTEGLFPELWDGSSGEPIGGAFPCYSDAL